MGIGDTYICISAPSVVNVIRTSECSNFFVHNSVVKNDFYVQRTILGLSTKKRIFRMK